MADDGGGGGIRGDEGEDAVVGGPGAADGVAAHVVADVAVHVLGSAAHGDFAEGGEVALAEEAVEGPLGHVGAVDAAIAEAGLEFGGGEIDELDLFGHLQDLVGEGFRDADTGDAGNGVVEAFQVLDVERGPDVDAGVEQVSDVFPALGVAAAGGIGVGELVDEDEAGVAGEGGFEVEFFQRLAAVWDLAAGEDGEVVDLGFGAGSAVGLDDADEDVGAFGAAGAGAGEHLPGLADAGGGAENDLQAAFAFGRGVGDQRVRVWAAVIHCRSIHRAGVGRSGVSGLGRREPG